MTEEFDHGHEPRGEEIALHQRFLTLLGQMEAAQAEGNESDVRRLDPLLERPDRPPLVLASGLLESQRLTDGPRRVVDGWAAELVRR